MISDDKCLTTLHLRTVANPIEVGIRENIVFVPIRQGTSLFEKCWRELLGKGCVVCVLHVDIIENLPHRATSDWSRAAMSCISHSTKHLASIISFSARRRFVGTYHIL